MNELSCINVMLFGAAPTRAAPSSPPTADSAEIVSTSRRDAARMMFAIRLTLPWYRPSGRIVTCHAAYLPRVAQVMGRESLKSTVCQTEPYQFRHLAPESAIGALSGPLDAPAPYPSEPTDRAREQCDGRRLGQRIISNGFPLINHPTRLSNPLCSLYVRIFQREMVMRLIMRGLTDVDFEQRFGTEAACLAALIEARRTERSE